ncbi:MAG: LacI family DNA-binding transcriptional regulator [Pseudomonadota bacterium]
MDDEISSANNRQKRNRKKKGEVKLADVAQRAGVSPATVSRSLNQPDKVSAKAREKIDAAIAELNWVPHAGARALASHSSRLIGVIVATLGNPNVATGLQAIERRLAKERYSLIIACDDMDAAKQIAHARMMLERGVDALILHGEGHHPDVFSFLQSQDTPVIVNHAFAEFEGCLSVGYDAYAEFSAMTRHLVELGHTRIGLMMLTTPELELAGDKEPFERVKTKAQSIFDTLAAHKLKIDPSHLTNTFFSINSGRRCFQKIMSSKSPPTAIFCMNDQMAIGAIIESRSMNIRVPEDVSIIGCDDIELAALIEPSLTTLRPPDEAMGRAAAEQALLCITENKSASGRIEFPAEFIIRSSTAPPKKP